MQDRAKIVESDGQDVTAHYQLAAWLALKARTGSCAGSIAHRRQPNLRQPVYLRRYL
jgi:uncharacterized protein YbbK (DUF523 family)